MGLTFGCRGRALEVADSYAHVKTSAFVGMSEVENENLVFMECRGRISLLAAIVSFDSYSALKVTKERSYFSAFPATRGLLPTPGSFIYTCTCS